MINNDEKYYYFAVKSRLELCSSEWLRNKTEAIINGDNCIQNTLNDALDYQRIKENPQKISKIEPYISQYNWKDIEFPSVQKNCQKLEQNNGNCLEYIICTTQYRNNKYCMQIKM